MGGCACVVITLEILHEKQILNLGSYTVVSKKMLELHTSMTEYNRLFGRYVCH